MAGAADLPFRARAPRFGAERVVCEMVASGEIAKGKPAAWARAELDLGEARMAVRIAGREPGPMAVVLGHFEAIPGFHGADLGLRVARKHLGRDLADLGGGEALRAEAVRRTDLGTVARAIRRIADFPRKPRDGCGLGPVCECGLGPGEDAA